MSTFLSKLAASKAATYAGIGLGILAALCVSNRQDVMDAIPLWGVRLCAIATLVSVVIASLGRGLADRRDPAPTDPAKIEAKRALFVSPVQPHPSRRKADRI